MFGIFKRHKERMAEVERKHEQVMQGFRKLDTARELLRQSASGELPPDNIVEIGDGFYVVQNPDGSRATVILDRSKVPVARVESFAAKPGVFQAKMDAYASQVERYAQLAKQAGLTSEHPSVKAMLENVPKLEVPKLEVPKLEIPEPPRFEFPPRPAQ